MRELKNLCKILLLDLVVPPRAAAIAVLWLYLQILGEDRASGLAVLQANSNNY